VSIGQRWFQPGRDVLLTGAGFTHPFRGYLATEMWAAIFNQGEIQQHDKLRKSMIQGDLNFETIYDMIMESPESEPGEKAAFLNALRNAYRQMDEIISDQANRVSAFAVCQSFALVPYNTRNEDSFSPLIRTFSLNDITATTSH
jgi:hypothetical protein